MSNASKRWTPRTFRVTFGEGHQFEGLEVHMRAAPMGLLLDMSEVYDGLDGIGDGAAMTGEQMAAFRKLVEMLASVVTWWNVDDYEGQAVRPDADGLMGQEPALIMTLFEAWQRRITAVAPPLPQSSDGTRHSAGQELSLPMEALSPNLSS